MFSFFIKKETSLPQENIHSKMDHLWVLTFWLVNFFMNKKKPPSKLSDLDWVQLNSINLPLSLWSCKPVSTDCSSVNKHQHVTVSCRTGLQYSGWDCIKTCLFAPTFRLCFHITLLPRMHVTMLRSLSQTLTSCNTSNLLHRWRHVKRQY